MLNEIIAIYAITDDLLKALGHQEDIRVTMSDAEVITSALVAARFFGGNQSIWENISRNCTLTNVPFSIRSPSFLKCKEMCAFALINKQK